MAKAVTSTKLLPFSPLHFTDMTMLLVRVHLCFCAVVLLFLTCFGTPANAWSDDCDELCQEERKTESALDMVAQSLMEAMTSWIIVPLIIIKEFLEELIALFRFVLNGIVSFVSWLERLFKSNCQLAREARMRYDKENANVHELIRKAQMFAQACHRVTPQEQEDWRLCNQEQGKINDQVKEARVKRRNAWYQYEEYRQACGKN